MCGESMIGREFTVRALASAGYRLTRLSTRLQPASAPSAGETPAHEKTLVGERDVEWAWTLAHLHRDSGRVLDFGSGNGMLALAASFAGNDVVAVDLEEEQYLFRGHRIDYRRGDFNSMDLEPHSFDQVINCSSIEHVGLIGRYGSPDQPDGDIAAMRKMADLLRPGGTMVLSIPVGVDGVYPPWHRVYGENREAKLLAPFRVTADSFWAKLGTGRYEPVDRETAFAQRGSATYYALGLYVLGLR
jgi:SAM-dependent methyltransferase